MQPFIKVLSKAVFVSFLISSTLWACQPKPEPLKPNAKEQASLDKLYNRCTRAAASTPSRKLKNLVRHRKPEVFFTCDDMRQLCEDDYTNDRCQSMMVVASIEHAFHRVCRTNYQASACGKLDACNIRGFETPECSIAIEPYNQ